MTVRTLRTIVLAVSTLASVGCAFRWSDDGSGFHYSIAGISTGRHEIDRIAMDAESRAKAECYVHGQWHASALVPVWTDEATQADGLAFVQADCSREDEFLSDLDDAIHGAGLTATDLAGVSIVEVTGKPSCKSEAGDYATYPACTNGRTIEVARGLARADRQAALSATFRVLLEARLVGNPWGLGEPSGAYTAQAWKDRMAEYERLPGWADTAGSMAR